MILGENRGFWAFRMRKDWILGVKSKSLRWVKGILGEMWVSVGRIVRLSGTYCANKLLLLYILCRHTGAPLHTSPIRVINFCLKFSNK